MHSAQVFVVLVASFSFTQAGGDMKCMGKDITLSDDSKAAIKTCYEANKPDEGSTMPKPCFSPCLYEKIGCVKDNKFDMDGFKSKGVVQFPEEAREKITASVQTCFDSFGSSLSMDDNCKTWQPFTTCFDTACKEACGKEFGMGQVAA